MTEQHPLSLYNSLTRTKEPFIPQDPKRVTMYNCGPTVYSYAHIGNARAAVVADVLFRVLRHIYGEDHVVYARNITDVDDKIIEAATEQGVDISVITEKYARIYNEDLAAIGCLPPTHQPKATEHISHMIEMISDLIDKDFAYESDGHVFFDVSKYDDYGQLSGNTLDALRGGDRVGEGEVARKRNAADFVLWKPELDGVGWEAPFGKGRPGWHIECSAMAKATLCDAEYGNTIDIHCGGIDLKFPHHENEKAQSCCANDTDKFANFWVHNEFLNMGSEKMSKSLGNVTLIHDLLKDWDGEVIRLALLKAHYRSELQWSEDLLRESKEQLDDWYNIKRVCLKPVHKVVDPQILYDVFEELNTPLFLSSLSQFLRSRFEYRDPAMRERVAPLLAKVRENAEINTSKFTLKGMRAVTKIVHEIVPFHEDMKATFVATANLLGLLQKDPEDWFKGGASADDEAKFDALAAQRQSARASKDWPAADAARDEAKALGIVLEDGPEGTTWRKA